MKRIIEGKCYDTATATEVASSYYSYKGDFDWVEETLYRTKSGRYFMHGMGGAHTRWCWYDENIWRGDGEGIVALTPAEAVEWLEANGKDVPAGCPEIEALVTEA